MVYKYSLYSTQILSIGIFKIYTIYLRLWKTPKILLMYSPSVHNPILPDLRFGLFRFTLNVSSTGQFWFEILHMWEGFELTWLFTKCVEYFFRWKNYALKHSSKIYFCLMYLHERYNCLIIRIYLFYSISSSFRVEYNYFTFGSNSS